MKMEQMHKMENDKDNYELNRTMLDAIPIGVTIFDENLNVIECNNLILSLFGTTKHYYTRHFLDLSPESQPNGDNSREKAAEILKRALNGENLTVEWMHLSPAGELIPFEITLTRAKYMGKYAILTYQYDLRNMHKMTDELKRQSKLLKERLEQQELISEISRSFISSGETQKLINQAITKLGNYYKVSRVVIFYLDYESGDANMVYHWSAPKSPARTGNLNIHSLIKDSFPQKMYDTTTVPIISCPDTATSTFQEFRDLLKDGISAFICAPLYVEGLAWGLLAVEQCFTPRNWTDNEKNFIAMTTGTIAGAIMLDIYNTKLKDALAKVVATNKAKSEFLSNMSHEMRTPMNAIINMTSIAKKTLNIERKNYALEKIEDASTHLLGVINDILDMSKIEANKFELVPVEFDFKKLVKRVVNVINFRIEEKHLKLTVQIDKNIPKILIGDDQRISQVITNLFSNAVKFTPENGSIDFDSQLLKEYNNKCVIQISIKDTGIGIRKEHQKNLFQSFQQAETSTSRIYGGTGLGLSISKSFVEMMGGNIWVESEHNKGSKFIFTMRVARGTENELQPKSQKESLRDDFKGHKVLLVEDVEINREIVLMLLEPAHLEIDCAVNGIQAVDMFIEEPEKYELIFMDVHMPGMDGYEATRQIRAYEEKLSGAHKRVPIIAMTANVFKEDINNCINAGMDDHLGKPLNIDNIMDKLRNYIIKQE